MKMGLLLIQRGPLRAHGFRGSPILQQRTPKETQRGNTAWKHSVETQQGNIALDAQPKILFYFCSCLKLCPLPHSDCQKTSR